MFYYKKIAIFLGNKLIRLMILLIAVTIISFILIDMSPIDPVRAYIGEMAVSGEQIAKLQDYWGVGQPMWEKALNWLWNVLHGDFGISLIYRVPVLEVIGERFSASLVLMFTSWMISGVLGFGLGTLAGMYRGR